MGVIGYVNIPRAETANIIHNILKANQKEITHTRHNNGTKLLPIPTKILQTNRRTSNGSTNVHSTSRSIYPKHGTQTNLPNTTKTQNNRILQIRDILLIYNQNKTNIEEMPAEFNKQQPAKKFTIEKETQIHKLPRPNNTRTKAETRLHNIQKTDTNRHHNTKRFMPPT
jgi:hypothetical protein